MHASPKNVTAQAAEHFQSIGENFGQTVSFCLFHGLVVRRYDFLLLASEVEAYPQQGVVSMFPKNGEPRNCWFLWCLVHEPGAYTPCEYMAEAPWPHRFVAYHRRGKNVVREWDRLVRNYNVRTQRCPMKTDEMAYVFNEEGQ